MPHRRTIISHGPRRPWRRPWRHVCRCGLGTWPCPAERMRRQQQAWQTLDAARPAWTAPAEQLPLLSERQDWLTPGQRARSAGAFRQ